MADGDWRDRWWEAVARGDCLGYTRAELREEMEREAAQPRQQQQQDESEGEDEGEEESEDGGWMTASVTGGRLEGQRVEEEEGEESDDEVPNWVSHETELEGEAAEFL